MTLMTTVEIDDKVSELLSEIAEKSGLPISEVLAGAVDMLWAEWSREQPPLTAEQEAAIREGLDAIERGETTPHEEVMAKFRAKYG